MLKYYREHRHIFNIVANFALLLSISVMCWHVHRMGNGNDIKLFEYPWTFRRMAYDQKILNNVTAPYADREDNKRSGPIRITAANTLQSQTDAELAPHFLHMKEELRCKDLTYASGTWSEKAVSPLCNCVINLHTTFAARMHEYRADTGAQDRLQENFAKHVTDFCAKYTRPTVYVESGTEGGTASTNVALGVVTWNTIAFMMSVYSVMYSYKEKGSNFWIYLFALHLIPIAFFLGTTISVGYNPATVLLLVCVILYAVANAIFVLLEIFSPMDKPYALRKSFLQWFAYVINFILVLTTANVLIQRRNHEYQLLTIGLGGVVGFLGLASDYATHIREIITEKTLKDDFRSLHKIIWVGLVVVIVALANVADIDSTTTPFSNAEASLWIVVPILLVPLLMLPNGWQKLIDHDVNTDENSPVYNTVPKPETFLLRDHLDFIARFIFTAAFVADLASLGNKDSYYVGPNDYPIDYAIKAQ